MKVVNGPFSRSMAATRSVAGLGIILLYDNHELYIVMKQLEVIWVRITEG